MARGPDLRWSRIGHDLWLHKRDQTGVVVQCTVRPRGFKPAQADQKVVFNLVANRFGENEPASPGGAQRENRFVQSPGGDNAGGQDV